MRHWFSMKMVDDDDDEDEDEDKKKNPFAEIMIYDAIGKSMWDDDAVSAASFVKALADIGDVDEIKLRINSPGGDVFDGVAIYNALKNHKAKITAHVDGLAASAASLVAMAASKIVMPSNAFMLVHNAAGFAMGGAEEMMAVAADLQRIDASMAATYVARTGQTVAKVKALMREDRLMDAKEAKELGYADEVAAPVKMTAKYSLRLLPKAAADQLRAATGTSQSDPPRPGPGPQGPGDRPVEPPAPSRQPAQKPKHNDPDPPDPPEPSKVTDISTAKAQGKAEHQAYVASVTDLCALARVPERVGGYVRANMPVDQVRKELLEAVAGQPLRGQHATASAPTAAAWGKITDKLNARAK